MKIIFLLTICSLTLLKLESFVNLCILIFINSLIMHWFFDIKWIIFMIMFYCTPNFFLSFRFIYWNKFFIIGRLQSICIFNNCPSFYRWSKRLKTICSHLHFIWVFILFLFILNRLLIRADRWDRPRSLIKVYLAFYKLWCSLSRTIIL